MVEIGDYVLVHTIKHVENTDMDGEPLPVWARIDDSTRDFDWDATLLHPRCSDMWGIDNDDLVPADQVTDEQWAQLVKWRLTHATD